MEQPPWYGDPYDQVWQLDSYYEIRGNTVAWNALRQFWGGAAQQGWAELQTALQMQPVPQAPITGVNF